MSALLWVIDSFIAYNGATYIRGLTLGPGNGLSWIHCQAITWANADLLWNLNRKVIHKILPFPVNTVSWNPSYSHGLTLIPKWMCNHMPNKVWDEIIYPYPKFNGAAGDSSPMNQAMFCWFWGAKPLPSARPICSQLDGKEQFSVKHC